MAGKIKITGGEMVSPFRTAVLLTAAVSVLTGCGVTPADGPNYGSYAQNASERVTGSNPDGTPEKLPFVLVDVDRGAAEALKRHAEKSHFKGAFTDRRGAADIRVGLGDVLRVTIFEAGSGGLFVPTGGSILGGNYVSIPDQEVDRSGSISVPYAAKNSDGGIIKVYGRRPIDIQAEIEQRISDRALEPQVIVSIVNRNSNMYSVIGDVGSPGRYGVSQNGVRILDAIGEAGGPSAQAYNTLVTLQRGNESATARLSTLINEPENNIFVRPNDTISLKEEERYYNIFGAVGSVERVKFDTENLSLADALAKAGGLDSERADPETVVLYRREDRETINKIGADLHDFKYQPQVPTVYRLNLKQPSSFFLAQQIPMRPDDIVYVSSHPFTNVNKLLQLVRDVLLIQLIDN